MDVEWKFFLFDKTHSQHTKHFEFIAFKYEISWIEIEHPSEDEKVFKFYDFLFRGKF